VVSWVDAMDAAQICMTVYAETGLFGARGFSDIFGARADFPRLSIGCSLSSGGGRGVNGS